MSRTWKDQRAWKEFKKALKHEQRKNRYYCPTCGVYLRTDKCPICKGVWMDTIKQ